MRIIIRTLNICFVLAFVFSFLQCGVKKSPECNSKKIQLLLEDIFNKKNYYYIVSPVQPLDSNDKKQMPIDSSMFFNYLYSENLNIPKKEFYLHWNKNFEPSYPDSVRLKVIDERKMKKSDAHVLVLNLLEVNSDTTNLKIEFGYSTNNNILKSKGTYSYLFDEKNCKWIAQDSTSWFY